MKVIHTNKNAKAARIYLKNAGIWFRDEPFGTDETLFYISDNISLRDAYNFGQYMGIYIMT